MTKFHFSPVVGKKQIVPGIERRARRRIEWCRACGAPAPVPFLPVRESVQVLGARFGLAVLAGGEFFFGMKMVAGGSTANFLE